MKIRSFHPFRLLAFLLPALVIAGCAGTELAELHLTSVLAEKAWIEEQKKLKRLRTESYTSEIQNRFDASSLLTPELDLILLPQTFSRYSCEDDREAIEHFLHFEIPPFCEVAWHHQEKDVTLIGGRAELDADFVKGKTRSEFKTVLSLSIGRQYDSYYQEKRNSRAETDVRESDNLLIFSLVSHYFDHSEWYKDARHFYLYSANHRLNLLITGLSKDMEDLHPAISFSLADFEDSLKVVHPDEIPFKQLLDEPVKVPYKVVIEDDV